ncbi:hypothetical protein PJH59_29405, partial [Mycobacterium kansasii]
MTRNADLSDKTESATSLADHVFFSFDVNLEFGGPIEIEMTRLSVRSTRSETIRKRASGESGAAEEYLS